jgi:hypothetical protein
VSGDLVTLLLAEAERWERLATEEGAAAARHRANGTGKERLADRLEGWRAGRMVSVTALRRLLAEHAAAHPTEVGKST